MGLRKAFWFPACQTLNSNNGLPDKNIKPFGVTLRPCKAGGTAPHTVTRDGEAGCSACDGQVMKKWGVQPVMDR